MLTAFVLPPSLDKDIQTLEEECAYARSLTPEQRLECCMQTGRL